MNSDRQGFGRAPAFSRPIRPFGPTTNGNDNAFQLPSSSARHVFPSSREMSDPLVRVLLGRMKHRAPFSRFLSGAKAGSMRQDRQGFGNAAAFSRAIRPFGPTTNGNDNAFQFPSSSGFHVFPSSRLMSDPLVPAVIQSLSDSDHCTVDRYPCGGVVEASQ